MLSRHLPGKPRNTLSPGRNSDLRLFGHKPATLRLVAQCLNQLCYHVPPSPSRKTIA
jgi:hypothetical protein